MSQPLQISSVASPIPTTASSSSFWKIACILASILALLFMILFALSMERVIKPLTSEECQSAFPCATCPVCPDVSETTCKEKYPSVCGTTTSSTATSSTTGTTTATSNTSSPTGTDSTTSTTTTTTTTSTTSTSSTTSDTNTSSGSVPLVNVALKHTGLCLDMSGSGTTAGTKALIWTCKTGSEAVNQTFSLDSTNRLIPKYTADKNLDMCLQGDNGSTATLQKCTTNPNQQWIFENSNLKNQAGGCLQVASDVSGTYATVNTCQGTDRERWQI